MIILLTNIWKIVKLDEIVLRLVDHKSQGA